MALFGMASSGTTGSEGTPQTFHSEFEALLNESVDKVKPGRIVPGTIVDIGKEVVTIDIGFKSDGVVPVEQFFDSEGKITVQIGDTVEVMLVAAENETGQVVLSKERADQFKVWRKVEDAYRQGDLVSGKILQKVKGGLHVDIGIPAFLPGSQIDIRPQRNLDRYLDQVMEFKVLKMSRDKGNIVLSRRAVLTSEREALRSETLKVLAEGVVLEGVVKNITDYGAFIDLGGIDGLLHITDVSWGRISHPSEKLSIGQTVPVVVLKYDQESQRVSLGMKQLKEDPWQTVAERFPVGRTVTGKVVKIEDYGAFVELEEGVDGLAHVSDMTWSKKVRHPSKIVSEGQVIEAVVLGIDSERQKISLGLKQLTVNPWIHFADSSPVGTRVKGKVRTIADFGIFVGVSDGIDGLVHVSDFSWTKRVKDPTEIHELFKKGDEVEAVILSIDVEHERLSLGIKQLTEDPWDSLSKRYPVGSKVHGKVTKLADFGVFVEIEPDVEGLIHHTELGLERGADHKATIKVGDTLDCELTKIDNEERKISLSVRALHDKRRERDSDTMGSYMVEDGGGAISIGALIEQKIKERQSE
jgi:small subunit ribosomal protein S1